MSMDGREMSWGLKTATARLNAKWGKVPLSTVFPNLSTTVVFSSSVRLESIIEDIPRSAIKVVIDTVFNMVA